MFAILVLKCGTNLKFLERVYVHDIDNIAPLVRILSSPENMKDYVDIDKMCRGRRNKEV